MTAEEYENLSEEQRTSMKNLQERSGIAWEDFLESALAPTLLCPYVGIPNFHGMFVGIETDGFTHS